MAALWPSLMWLPVLEAFYHAKTGVQKDFTMKLCLGEIMGGKAHKMIIQYYLQTQKIVVDQTKVRVWDRVMECQSCFETQRFDISIKTKTTPVLVGIYVKLWPMY